jgi:hypothetical protein
VFVLPPLVTASGERLYDGREFAASFFEEGGDDGDAQHSRLELDVDGLLCNVICTWLGKAKRSHLFDCSAALCVLPQFPPVALVREIFGARGAGQEDQTAALDGLCRSRVRGRPARRFGSLVDVGSITTIVTKSVQERISAARKSIAQRVCGTHAFCLRPIAFLSPRGPAFRNVADARLCRNAVFPGVLLCGENQGCRSRAMPL